MPVKIKKLFFAAVFMSLSLCVFAQGEGDDLSEESPLNAFEEAFTQLMKENADAIDQVAEEATHSDSGKVLQALCVFIRDFKKAHSGALPTLGQVHDGMNAFFDKTGLGTDHCYPLCENYVTWTESFENLWWGGLGIARWLFDGGWYFSGGQLVYYWPDIVRAVKGQTAHLDWRSEKLDQVLYIIAGIAALTPYTFPLTIAIGCYYYDDLFPGKQSLIEGNALNSILLARVGYSGVLASVGAFWARTWAHRVPKAGLAPAVWNSAETLRWALYALPVGLALGYVLDNESVVVDHQELWEDNSNLLRIGYVSRDGDPEPGQHQEL